MRKSTNKWRQRAARFLVLFGQPLGEEDAEQYRRRFRQRHTLDVAVEKLTASTVRSPFGINPKVAVGASKLRLAQAEALRTLQESRS